MTNQEMIAEKQKLNDDLYLYGPEEFGGSEDWDKYDEAKAKLDQLKKNWHELVMDGKVSQRDQSNWLKAGA